MGGTDLVGRDQVKFGMEFTLAEELCTVRNSQ